MKTIIEPFRIKMVEPIRVTTAAEREARLREAHYNLFNLRAEDVTIDLLTDSGTGAMSCAQWACMMEGDESYAGGRSFYFFRDTFFDLTGFRHIIPTHQGRASEKILFSVAASPADIIPSNTHFDTTRANVEYRGAEARDLVVAEAKDFESDHAFKGNMDVNALRSLLASKERSRVPLVMLTVTNNSWGGQPVSMENIRAVSALCREYRVPLFLDACRFAENAYFIKIREKGFEGRSVESIAREMFSHADGCTFSAKKDAIANIGGMLAMNDEEWAGKARNLLILTEGFPTYGGLAGRDLAAIAQGVKEVMDETYLQYRIVSTAYLGRNITEKGVPAIRPFGGHAVFIDAKRFVPHIPPEQFPAHALACELYLVGGIRGVEIGTLMFGKKDPKTKEPIAAEQELLRLAIPRRTYTQSHIDYVVESIVETYERRGRIRGYRILEEAEHLRHFTAKLAPIK